MNTDLHQYSDTDGCMSGYQTWLYQSLVYTEQLSELTASGSDQVELGWFWTCLLYDWSLVYSQTVHVIWSNSDISRADCMCLGTQLAWTWLISGKQWQYGTYTDAQIETQNWQWFRVPCLPRAQASSLPRKPPPMIATDLADCSALSRLKKSFTFTYTPTHYITKIINSLTTFQC